VSPRTVLDVLVKRKTLVPAKIKYCWHTIRCDQSWIGGTGGNLHYEVFENISLITCSIGERIQTKYVCETRIVFSNSQCHSHVYCILPPTHTQRFLVVVVIRYSIITINLKLYKIALCDIAVVLL